MSHLERRRERVKWRSGENDGSKVATGKRAPSVPEEVMTASSHPLFQERSKWRPAQAGRGTMTHDWTLGDGRGQGVKVVGLDGPYHSNS